MAVSVLRRYTPPTCTLEIMAKKSPLSRWTNQTVLNDVHFRLAFDGPHLQSDEHVHVEGDRHQLEILCDIVESYIQQILSQSTSDFHRNLLQPHIVSQHEASTSPQNAQQSPAALPPKSLSLEQERSVVPPEVMMELRKNRFAQPSGEVINQTKGLGIAIPSGLALIPSGKLKHTLCFGLLATRTSGQSTTLSTIELFDLANALDQYKAENLSIPDVQKKRWLGSTPQWMRAVAVLVFAVGVTTAVTEILQQPTPELTSSSPDLETPQSELEEQEDLSTLAPTSREEAGLESRRTRNRARRVQRSDNGTLALDADTQTNDSPQTVKPPNDDSLSSDEESGSDSTLELDRRTLRDFAAIPPIEQGTTRQQPGEPLSPNAQDPDAQSLDEQNTNVFPGTIATAPATIAQNGAQDERSSSEFSSDAVEESVSPPEPGIVPQVDEVRAYFQRSWQPPEGLERPLEYQLVLNPDGSLAGATPLGQTARTYSNQAGIPAIGSPFVSSLDSQSSPKIRLVLQPNGQVRAFLESWN